MVKSRGLEFTWWKMDQDMKDNSEIRWNMVLEHKDLTILRHMLAIIRKIDQMDKDSTIGQTEIIIKAHFQMDWDMGKVTSDKERPQSNIEDNIKTIRSVVTGK